MNGTRGLVIAALTAFLLGCSSGLIGGILLTHVIGGGMPRWGMQHFFMGRPRVPGPPGMHPPEGPIMDLLSRQLDLTAEQHQKIEQILDQGRMKQMAVRESTHAAIKRVLTEEQREGWSRFEMRLRHEARNWAPPAPEGPR